MKTRTSDAELRNDLKKGIVEPVYFLYGEEDFLVDEAVELILSAAINETERKFNLDVVYGSDADAGSVLTMASTFPMLADRRVIVVRDFEKLAGNDRFGAYLGNPALTTTLVLVARKPDMRRSPFHQMKSGARVVEFPRLYDNQVAAWIEKRVEQQGYRIDPAGARLLADYSGTVLREIHNELEKLYAFIGDRKIVSVEDVEAVSGMSREFSIFELQRAIGRKDVGKSVEIIDRMVGGGQPPIRVAVMLFHYFVSLRKLLEMKGKGVSQGEQASELGIRPFFMSEYNSALGQYSEHELENALLCIARADGQLKGSTLTHRQVLQFMVVSILHGGGNTSAV
jgi:DNA polymerase-3 subunit delta